MKKTEEYFLINKQRNRVKRFRKFENINNQENDFIEIEYCCVYKSSIQGLKSLHFALSFS